jgi:hypothetical protein
MPRLNITRTSYPKSISQCMNTEAAARKRERALPVRHYGLLVVRLTRTDQSYTTTICLGYDILLPGRSAAR